MIYELKQFDTPLIRFSAESGAEPDVHILWTDENKKELLPLDLPERCYLRQEGVQHFFRAPEH